ncbi:MAG: UDP-N-acetylmuramoyl-L-alanyl-D-glutamate--2,6-diaminopimelate ligase [Bacteroidota bacterium]
MRTLSDILTGLKGVRIEGESERKIGQIQMDSRRVEKEDVFVAVPGTQVDGHAFIDKAISQGARTIVCEQLPEQPDPACTWVVVPSSHTALAEMAANYYERPARELIMVGITGTNGKSSCVSMLHQLYSRMGYTVGMLSTVVNLVGAVEVPATHTTPDPLSLQALLRDMVNAGCSHCFMEVSSHALVQGRTHGIPFRGAGFTNITHDHLDYHGTFKAYIEAKKMLFDGLGKEAVAVVNADDRNGKVMLQNTVARKRAFGLKRMAEYRAKIQTISLDGLELEIDYQSVWFRLRGRFNAYNLLLVYGLAVELGEEKEDVLQALSEVEGADGRFQVLRDPKSKQTAIVDYAHTPDALENVLSTVQDMLQGQGNILVVVGAGGNRDKAKRPKMAEIAARLGDQVILTSDNPRNEEPAAILTDMEAGLGATQRRKVLTVVDRREAIRLATRLAQPGDLILIAGKGHETYQDIKGIKHPFDDREELMKAWHE